MLLNEGRSREVRCMRAALDVRVNRLLHTGHGPVAIGYMGRGMTRLLSEVEIGALYGVVGTELK